VLLQGFFRETHQRVGCFFQPASAMSQPASVCHTNMSGVACVQCTLGGVACVEPLSLGPFEPIGVSSPTCVERALAVPPRDGG
jgi:hypothetical protein